VHDAASLHDQLVASATHRARPLREVAPHVPPAVARVIDRALELTKADRWASAREMQGALRAARAVMPTVETQGPVPSSDRTIELSVPASDPTIEQPAIIVLDGLPSSGPMTPPPRTERLTGTGSSGALMRAEPAPPTPRISAAPLRVDGAALAPTLASPTGSNPHAVKASGSDPNLKGSGSNPHLGSSGAIPHLGSSGTIPHLGSSGAIPHLGSSGTHPSLGALPNVGPGRASNPPPATPVGLRASNSPPATPVGLRASNPPPATPVGLRASHPPQVSIAIQRSVISVAPPAPEAPGAPTSLAGPASLRQRRSARTAVIVSLILIVACAAVGAWGLLRGYHPRL
jgi:serine/threonine-protein kinase